MVVLDRTIRQKRFTGMIFGVVLIGGIVFSGLLLKNASQLSNSIGTQYGNFFGLRLFELKKYVLPGGGYTASMSFFGRQLAVYFLVWVLLGLVLAVYRSKRV